MKNVFKNISVFALSGLILFVSCSEDELVNDGNARSAARLNQAELTNLEDRIAKDENFDALHQIFDEVLLEADPREIQSLDEDRLLNEGNPYIAAISGLSLERVSYINENIATLTTAVLENYPELRDLSPEDLKQVIVNASQAYSSAKPSKACLSCARVGRANMAAGIFLGAATGSAFGFFGAWAGATVGFWVAAEQALACIEQYC